MQGSVGTCIKSDPGPECKAGRSPRTQLVLFNWVFMRPEAFTQAPNFCTRAAVSAQSDCKIPRLKRKMTCHDAG